MHRPADRCPLCDSDRIATVFPGFARVRRCGACDVAWTVGGPQGATAYDESFFSGDYYTAYFERAGQWRHEARLRLRWLRASTAPTRVLEIGCGGGFFLEAARAAGMTVQGIEPAAEGAAYGRERLRLPVVTGTFEAHRPTGTYDAVCAFHVLEHVDDPRAFLEGAHEVLEEGGWLALEVPNIDSDRARRDGPRWFNLVPDYHLWHFSPRSLAGLVETTGFGTLRVDTVWPRFYLRARKLLTRSGLRSAAADVRAAPTPRRVHPTRGDYLRLLAVRR